MQASSRSGSLTLAMARIINVPRRFTWGYVWLGIGQLIMQWVVFNSIHRSQWSSGTSNLTWVALSAVTITAVIVLSTRTDYLSLYLIGVVCGCGVSAWLMSDFVRATIAQELSNDTASLLRNTFDIMNELLLQAIWWWRSPQTATPVMFVFVLSLLSFGLASLSTWVLFRPRFVWVSVAISALPLFTNYTFSPLTRRDEDLVLFTGLALLLVLGSQLIIREEVWQAAQFERPSTAPLQSTWSAILIVVPAIVVANLLPLPSTSEFALNTWSVIREPFTAVRNGWDSLLGSGATNQAGGFSTASSQVAGARLRNEQEVLRVQTTAPDYLRATTFDTYTGQGWVAQTPVQQSQLLATDFLTNRSEGRLAVVHTVEVRRDRSDNLLLTMGSPLNYSRDARITHLADIELTVDSVLAVSSATPLLSGQVYTSTGMISQAYDSQLRAAPAAPAAVMSIYTVLPDDIPPRVRAYAQDIIQAANATTTYDQALAIQTHLRQFTYDERRARPPSTRDWVDYFLFDGQRGYCDDFATAMTVLLRTQGIPARYVQGYAMGSRDPVSGQYIIRESMAHSWVEVYFGEYGWQRFEPTPAGYVNVLTRTAPASAANDTEATTPSNTAASTSTNRMDSLERFEPPNESGGDATAMSVTTPQTTAFWWWWIAGGLVLIGMWRITGWWWHSKDEFWRIHMLYQTLCLVLRWGTFVLPANVTPWQVELAVSHTRPDITALIRPFLRDYTQTQYAAHKPTTWAIIPWSTLLIQVIRHRFAHERATFLRS